MADPNQGRNQYPPRNMHQPPNLNYTPDYQAYNNPYQSTPQYPKYNQTIYQQPPNISSSSYYQNTSSSFSAIPPPINSYNAPPSIGQTNPISSQYGQPPPIGGGMNTSNSIYGQPPPIVSTQYGQPPPIGGTQYGQPPPIGGAQYGQPPSIGGTQYGQPPPIGGTQYSQPPPIGGTQYSQPPPIGGTQYGQPSPIGSTQYGQPPPISYTNSSANQFSLPPTITTPSFAPPPQISAFSPQPPPISSGNMQFTPPPPISSGNMQFSPTPPIVTGNPPVITGANSFAPPPPINSLFIPPPPPPINLGPSLIAPPPQIILQEKFDISTEKCVFCSEQGVNLILPDCYHLCHLLCYLKSKICTKCDDGAEKKIDIPYVVDMEKCAFCRDKSNLLMCKECKKQYCFICVSNKKLENCCDSITKTLEDYKNECPGCLCTMSYKNFIAFRCKDHDVLCKKCWNISFTKEKCVMGCELPIPMAYYCLCDACDKMQIKYFGDFVCPDDCQVCDSCQTIQFLRCCKDKKDPICAICNNNLLDIAS